MLPLPTFELHRPQRISDAIDLLGKFGAEATLIAGGTDLLPNMKHGLLQPQHLVSLREIDGLNRIEANRDALHIGAMTPLALIAQHEAVRERAPALAEAARSVGGPHHRAMGTIGGNLCLDTRCRYYNQTHFWRQSLGYCLKKDGSVCHVVKAGQRCVAAASNDTAAAAVALDATLHLVGPGGMRDVKASEFYVADGRKNLALIPSEMLVGVSIPFLSGRRSVYEKLRRRQSIDFPLLSVAARLDVGGSTIAALEVVVSSLAAKPRRIASVAKIANGRSTSDRLVEIIALAAQKECHPLSNIEGDVLWRKQMVTVFVRRALGRLGLT